MADEMQPVMDDANYITHSFDARTARILTKLIEDVEELKEEFGVKHDDNVDKTSPETPENDKSDDKTTQGTAKKTAASRNG